MGNDPNNHVEGSFPHSEALQQQTDLAAHNLFSGPMVPEKKDFEPITEIGLDKSKDFIPAMSKEERKELLSRGEVVPTTRLYRLSGLVSVFFTLPPVMAFLFNNSYWFRFLGDSAALVTIAGSIVYSAGLYGAYKYIWKFLCSLKGQKLTTTLRFWIVRISTFVLMGLYLMQSMIFYFKMENPYEIKVAFAIIISITLAFFLSKRPIILVVPVLHIIWYTFTS